jgi:isopentenyl diphosphate isomerase/L-lactate dehydrogenase-like FMN-dependent dehydrogenase
MRIDNHNQLAEAFQFAKSASPSGELILEEYMEGSELSIDAIIFNNEITFTGVADRIIEYPPYFVETGHTMPSTLPAEITEEACDVMRHGIRALGITIGAAKGDIKVTSKGVMIGELAARLSGGFMSAYTYPLSSGVDLMRAAVEVALGQEPGNLEPVIALTSIERAIITKPGIVKRIDGLEEALKVPGIKEIFLNVKLGDKTVNPRSNVEKAGHIIAAAATLAEAEDAVAKCKALLNIEIIEEPELSMEMINTSAREKFKKICYVCRNCDGRDCPSGVPGMGAVGTGASFRRNLEALKNFKISTRLIHGVTEPDTSAVVLGLRVSMPVMAAPITGAVTNLGGAVDELDYNLSVCRGCAEAGTIPFVGDGATPDKYRIGLKGLADVSGRGAAIFKPRSETAAILERIRAAEDAGAMAVGMDIDAVVFTTMAMKNQAVGPKSLNELKTIISSTKLPFILKGIMNPGDAVLAAEAGAAAIIVSNHGGRVLDEMAGSMDVLEDIVKEVRGKLEIMADGGFRNGVDVLKALALGAGSVLIGRPVAIAAVGMGAQGVAFYLKQIQKDLEKAMILTGCAKISDIPPDIVKFIRG